jgi:hypothetical protein
VRLPGTVTKNKKPLSLALTGPLLALIARRWTQRLPDCPFVFHRQGRPLVRFDGPWTAACTAVGLPGLLFRDLRRSGARNLRRAAVDEHVIQRIGGWKTPSMFRRYDIVDERDLRDAGERFSSYFATATTAAPTVVPLRRRSRRPTVGVHNPLGGQNTDNRRTAGAAGGWFLRPLATRKRLVDMVFRDDAGREARTPTALRPADFKFLHRCNAIRLSPR